MSSFSQQTEATLGSNALIRSKSNSYHPPLPLTVFGWVPLYDTNGTICSRTRLALIFPYIGLVDTRGKYWSSEAWEKRAVWGLELGPELGAKLEPDGLPLRHCFFTMHTENLERNEHVGYQMSGDVFILRVSDTLDENGHAFYVDEKPGDLSLKLVNALCDRAAVVLKTTKTHDDCCEWMSKYWGITAHRPISWMYHRWIVRTRKGAGTTV